ncbi:MAG: hypothetical protein M1826_004241 [Phylliscum demangeonii]|nr:MAG: hypothetical protein M1826_004241 [Phylliscum demangeonii]
MSWIGRNLLRQPIWQSAIATEAGEAYLNSRRAAVYAISTRCRRRRDEQRRFLRAYLEHASRSGTDTGSATGLLRQKLQAEMLGNAEIIPYVPRPVVNRFEVD